MKIQPPPLPFLPPDIAVEQARAASSLSTPTAPAAGSPAPANHAGSVKLIKDPIPLKTKGISLTAKDPNDPKEIKKAAQMMEGFFLSMLLKEMDKTVPKSELMGGGFAEKIFKDMFYDKMSDELAKTGQAGLGDMITRQLTKQIARTPVTYSFTKVPKEPLPNAEKVNDVPE